MTKVPADWALLLLVWLNCLSFYGGVVPFFLSFNQGPEIDYWVPIPLSYGLRKLKPFKHSWKQITLKLQTDCTELLAKIDYISKTRKNLCISKILYIWKKACQQLSEKIDDQKVIFLKKELQILQILLFN